MKKIVNLRCYVSLNGAEYEDTSFRTQLRYLDDGIECSTSEVITTDWNRAYELISQHRIRNAEIGTHFGKPCLVLYTPSRHYFTCVEKKFRSLKYKWVAEKYELGYTIEELAENLPAEQFCEWLKDQGIFSVKI